MQRVQATELHVSMETDSFIWQESPWRKFICRQRKSSLKRNPSRPQFCTGQKFCLVFRRNFELLTEFSTAMFPRFLAVSLRRLRRKILQKLHGTEFSWSFQFKKIFWARQKCESFVRRPMDRVFLQHRGLSTCGTSMCVSCPLTLGITQNSYSISYQKTYFMAASLPIADRNSRKIKPNKILSNI